MNTAPEESEQPTVQSTDPYTLNKPNTNIPTQNDTVKLEPEEPNRTEPKTEPGTSSGTSYTISNEKTTKKTTVTREEVTRREVRSPDLVKVQKNLSKIFRQKFEPNF